MHVPPSACPSALGGMSPLLWLREFGPALLADCPAFCPAPISNPRRFQEGFRQGRAFSAAATAGQVACFGAGMPSGSVAGTEHPTYSPPAALAEVSAELWVSSHFLLILQLCILREFKSCRLSWVLLLIFEWACNFKGKLQCLESCIFCATSAFLF